jgi:preprotein translocase SecF subunit
VFNLVGKRYIFLFISLLIIVPGTLSLIFKGLDVGIDFAGGSSLQFRPAQQITSTNQIIDLLEQTGLKDVQVNIGTAANTPGANVAWVRLNTQIDSTVQAAIQADLKTKYGSTVTPTFDPLVVTSGGKSTTITVITIVNTATGAKSAFKASDLQTLLAKLPDTTNPASTSSTVTAASTPTASATGTVASGTPTATPTPAPTATPTPVATATATPAASGTPSATPTVAATPTTAGTIPVKVSDVTVGSTIATINILTTTTTDITNVRQIQSAFLSKYNNYLYSMDNSSVSGSVASDTIRNSILAVFAASALILLYVWFAFRKVQKPWRYGASAIIALLHDVLVVLGVFSILGWTLHIQIDSLFITALLTVVGFSVHDTIVVFDRIRENMQRRSSESFEQIVNASLVQTLSRSLNTSLTVLFTLSALTLFGGDSIRTFTFALLIGIFSGTYSSIFNASMILVIWERGELGLWRLNRDNRGRDGRIHRPTTPQRELVKSRG